MVICGTRNSSRWKWVLHLSVFLLLTIFPGSSPTAFALPSRLVLFVDGVAYRDMKALQEGVTRQDSEGRETAYRGFTNGFFPVSRMVSTFPSVSDPAWTDILGDRPLPGYQRTFFGTAANRQIFQNGVTTSMEYEWQMTWQVESNWKRTMDYIRPLHAFKSEISELVESFLNSRSDGENYFAMIRSTDSAQHLNQNIFAMLSALDEKLEELRARYKAREGRDLEILIISDHGNNHAGQGKRLPIRSFLKSAGYRITKSLVDARDVVLPTAGIESWVEIHNVPSETERLLEVLSHLEGVDILTAPFPGEPDRFIVMNSKQERAIIDWLPAKGALRYSTETGDPLGYRPVVEALSREHRIDSDGFATADAWMQATWTHRYPLALERIVRGHTRIALNPATILISLNNDYVHCGWLIRRGSVLTAFGGTHGGLDGLNSNGILLSNFAPTKDTCTCRVAALYDGFKGLRDYRAEGNGADWLFEKSDPAKAYAINAPLAETHSISGDEPLLRIWTQSFTNLATDVPVEIVFEKLQRFPTTAIHRGDPRPVEPPRLSYTLGNPLPRSGMSSCERIYALPPGLVLEPKRIYRLSGSVQQGEKTSRIFQFSFHTDALGAPLGY
jgi:hypothetical protein